MEDKKDFDKDKQEMGTQQMPHVPTEGDEDGKKGIIVLFGHEFDKKKAEEGVTDEASGGNAGASKPETGGNGDNAVNGGNSGSNGGSINGGGGSKPQHTHNWVAQTTVVHHEAQYQTIHHDAVYGTRVTCNQCHADLTNQDVFAHFEESFLNGGSCESYSTVDYQISPAWDEQVLVSDAWDETVTTGYKCSGCPATK